MWLLRFLSTRFRSSPVTPLCVGHGPAYWPLFELSNVPMDLYQTTNNSINKFGLGNIGGQTLPHANVGIAMCGSLAGAH